MLERGSWLALGVVLVCFACSGSATTVPRNTAPGADGFRLYAGLGDTCRASVAVAPASSYRSLSFIPCSWGEAYCSELDWDGAVKWDPTGTGDDLLKFSLQPALDSTGALRRILVTRQYPMTSLTDGVPFEAVAYDAASGMPLAAWRNPGDPLGSTRGDRLGNTHRSCAINVAIGTDDALVLATPSGSTDVLMARERLQPGPSSRAFEPITADQNVMRRAPIASGNTAAFYEDSGRMWRVDLAGNAVAADSGPGQRLWPSIVAGNDVLARAASPTTDGYYWFNGVGSYDHIAVLAPMLLADATRLVWVTQTSDEIEVRSAPRNAPDPSAVAKLVATMRGLSSDSTIPVGASIVTASIGDGVMAIQTENPMQRSSTLYLVALDTGAVRQRSIHGGSTSMKLLANSATQAWFGHSEYLIGDETQFDAIVMLDMARTCEGTPSCTGLAADACSAAPGCQWQATCAGTPTDPCTYTTETTCFEHVCAWDALNDVCSPVESCAGAPDEACRNTAGCTFSACSPTVGACSELGSGQCKAQPGCSLSE